ncbi:RHS repeat-associated core domain-containing protein [Atopomonas hussainii]|uniref:RHS repeat-associated core domain-containing protein n=1 Tax=Atopomonas hussainii TaxID=1429083 RepID=A0A1H7N871_9GAMM|nr:FG-GAP-like repeat-containing protein [Atopomonas hussainii]SEL19694.1 RHS repeat-associated core domain-containing protein [Atopomonas hussainii]
MNRHALRLALPILATATFALSTPSYAAQWNTARVQALTGDYNGDGQPDIYLKPRDGFALIGLELPAAIPLKAPFPPVVLLKNGAGYSHLYNPPLSELNKVNWQPLAYQLQTGDVNGDGLADLIMQPQQAGSDLLIVSGNPQSQGLLATQSAQGLGIELAASNGVTVTQGDWNADGKLDLRIKHPTQGQKSFSLINGELVAQSDTPTTPSNPSTPGQLDDSPQSFSALNLALPAAGVSASGDAQYGYPVSLPEGINGLTPQLSINYIGNNEPSLVGRAWALGGISAIYRCAKTIAQDGAYAPIALASSDRLCLDGMRLQLASGQYLQPGSVYYTELDSFSRITQKGTANNPIFEVKTQSGQIIEYGGATASIRSQGKVTEYLWAINTASDRFGNNINYSYEESASSLVPSEIRYADIEVKFTYADGTEKLPKYFGGGFSESTKLLKTIDVNAGSQRLSNVTLGYGASTLNSQQHVLKHIQSCAWSNGEKSCIAPATFDYSDASTQLQSAKPFTDTLGGMTRKMANPSMFSLDWNGDGIDDMFTTTMEVGSQGQIGNYIHTVNIFKKDGSYTQKTIYKEPLLTFSADKADFDGDGKDEVYFLKLISQSNVGSTQYWTMQWLMASEAGIKPITGQWQAPALSMMASYTISNANGLFLKGTSTDINNDGRTDLILPFNGQWTAFISTSTAGAFNFTNKPALSGFTTQEYPWIGTLGSDPAGGAQITTNKASQLHAAVIRDNTTTTPSALINLGVTLNRSAGADLNGDGLQDFIVPDASNKVTVMLNTGGALSANLFKKVPTSFDASEVLPTFKYRSSEGDYPAKAADLNGDGRQEIIYTAKDSRYLRLSFNNEQLTAAPLGISTSRMFVNDFSKLSASCQTQINQFNSFISQITDPAAKAAFRSMLDLIYAGTCAYNPDGMHGDPAMYYIGNFTGSGADSIIVGTPVFTTLNAATTYYSGDKWHLYTQSREFPELLSKVDNGAGNVVSYEYTTLHDTSVATAANDAVYPDVAYRAPKPVVKQLLSSDGVGGTRTQSYRYQGAKLNRQGRGFLGFASIEVQDQARESRVVRQLRQDFPYIGALKQEEQYLADKLNLRVTNTWADKQRVAGKVFFPYLANAVNEQFEAGVAVAAQSTAYEYDADYGTLTSTIEKTAATAAGLGSPQRTVTVTRQYQNDSADWLIGFLRQETHTSSANGVARTRTHTYQAKPGTLAVASQTQYLGDADNALQTSFTYDGQGRLTSSTQSAAGLPARTTTLSDYQGPWPQTVKNPLNHTLRKTYDRATGQVLTSTDANDLTTTNRYDAFGRVLSTLNPDGSLHTTAYKICGQGAVVCPARAKLAVQQRTTNSNGDQQGAPEQWQYLDQLGRTLQTRHQSFDGNWVKVDQTYDALGRITHTTEPYVQTSTPLVTVWDNQDRPRQRQLPGGATLSFDYGANSTGGTWRQYSLSYEENGRKTRVERRENNALGQLVLSVNAAGSAEANQTRYQYDADGNLARVEINADPRTQVQMSYDLAGNRITLSDPNSGLQRYHYNAFGELRETVASDGSKIVNQYDPLSRLTTREDLAGDGSVQDASTWQYDQAANGIGLLSAMGKHNQSFLQVYSYDQLSRLQMRQTSIRANDQVLTYNDGQVYDGFSRPSTVQDASGFRYTMHYNGYGYLAGESNHADSKPLRQILAQNARGQATRIAYGNGIVSEKTYDDDTGWLKQIISGTQAGPVQHLSYQYGQNGVLLSRSDARGLTESFNYDLLQRLTSSTRVLGSETLSDTYRYDNLGNLLQNPQFTQLDYGQYDATGQSHCAAQGAQTPPGPHAVLKSTAGYYCYDSRGNQITAPNRQVSYSLYDKPLRITHNGQHSDFQYDPERRRFLQVSPQRITVYLDEGRFEEILDNGKRWQNSYIDGYLQVQRDPGSNQLRLNYQLQDQLGSLETVTDANGALLEKRSYAPFGGVRGADWSNTPAALLTTRRGFTDHEHLAESGLIHMNGRAYDPALGRFLSADIVYQDTANAQFFNRYSYVFNSPFSGVDPTGYFCIGFCGLNIPFTDIPLGYELNDLPEKNLMQKPNFLLNGLSGQQLPAHRDYGLTDLEALHNIERYMDLKSYYSTGKNFDAKGVALRGAAVAGGTGQIALGIQTCAGVITCSIGGAITLKGLDNVIAAFRGKDTYAQKGLEQGLTWMSAQNMGQLTTEEIKRYSILTNAALDLSTSAYGVSRMVPLKSDISISSRHYFQEPNIRRSLFVRDPMLFERAWRQTSSGLLVTEGILSTTTVIDAYGRAR